MIRDVVVVEMEAGTATVTLNRPAAMNALSRDLRDLAVVKTHDGYQLPQDAAAAPVETLQSSLWHALNSWLRAATPAQNLLVLHTPPGGAQPLGTDPMGRLREDEFVLV